MSNNLRDGIERIGYVGWVEFASCKATTHIACILANGSVYFPEGFDEADMTDFRNAEATGRFWPLVRGEWRGDPVPVLHRETKPDKSIQQERSAGMSNLLRDRIAAAIDQKYNEEAIGHTYEVCVHAADAVIEELGIYEDEMGTGAARRTRLVSDWEKPMSGRMGCNPHPGAPHGFDRNASHNEGRSVCDCEHWSPPDEDDPYEAKADAERQQWADDEGIPR